MYRFSTQQYTMTYIYLYQTKHFSLLFIIFKLLETGTYEEVIHYVCYLGSRKMKGAALTLKVILHPTTSFHVSPR